MVTLSLIMNTLQKTLLFTLTILLLVSQIQLSVYAIHCLCSGEIHLSLTLDKECSSSECKSFTKGCCDEPTGECPMGDTHTKTDCHAPRSNIDLGVDLEGALVNQSFGESDQWQKGFDFPLFLLYSSLKIADHQVVASKYERDAPLLISGFRYLLYGEMLC